MPIAQALRQEGIKKGGEKQASIKISVSVSVKWHGETICEAINGSDGDWNEKLVSKFTLTEGFFCYFISYVSIDRQNGDIKGE